jgi:hypothetical protein
MTKHQDRLDTEDLMRRLEADQRAMRDQYWKALYLMRNEYLEENKGVVDPSSRPTMHYWAELKYGLRMHLDGQGNYLQDYTVVDPKRFMFFQLKFMK